MTEKRAQGRRAAALFAASAESAAAAAAAFRRIALFAPPALLAWASASVEAALEFWLKSQVERCAAEGCLLKSPLSSDKAKLDCRRGLAQGDPRTLSPSKTFSTRRGP